MLVDSHFVFKENTHTHKAAWEHSTMKTALVTQKALLKRVVVSLFRKVAWSVVERTLHIWSGHSWILFLMKEGKMSSTKEGPKLLKNPHGCLSPGTIFLISDPILFRTPFHSWLNSLEVKEWFSCIHVWVDKLGEWIRIITVKFLGCFLCPWHCPKCFIGISLSASSLIVQILWIKYQGKDRWGNLPKATQLLSGRTKIWTQSPYSSMLSLWISMSKLKIVPLYVIKQSLI